MREEPGQLQVFPAAPIGGFLFVHVSWRSLERLWPFRAEQAQFGLEPIYPKDAKTKHDHVSILNLIHFEKR